MKVLVIGSGGREHALLWKLSQSPDVTQLYCAPGNAGTSTIAKNVPIPVEDIDQLLNFAKDEGVELTVVGPELPLTLGIVDLFQEAGVACFGPTKGAAQLEGSKVFAKEFMGRHNIPTAESVVVGSEEEAEGAFAKFGLPIVLKVDGLASGKGVFVCATRDEFDSALFDLFDDEKFGDAAKQVVVEKCLAGEEVSYIGICDGKTFLPFASSQDHKRLLDGDQGPNTGGMGAYSPAPILTPTLECQIQDGIIYPVLKGMAEEGNEFRGFLYVGLMITPEGPKVLEFNVRFGDPECQPIMARLKTDLVTLIKKALDGSLEGVKPEWDERTAVCVVMAAEGYPSTAAKGVTIQGLDSVTKLDGVSCFHAGTTMHDQDVVVSGGRVLGVTALGEDLNSALSSAYSAVDQIDWPGKQFRKDIGKKGLGK